MQRNTDSAECLASESSDCSYLPNKLFPSTLSVELLPSCFSHSGILSDSDCGGDARGALRGGQWHRQDTAVNSKGGKLQSARFVWIVQGPSSISLQHLDCFTRSQIESKYTLILNKQCLLSKQVRVVIQAFSGNDTAAPVVCFTW